MKQNINYNILKVCIIKKKEKLKFMLKKNIMKNILLKFLKCTWAKNRSYPMHLAGSSTSFQAHWVPVFSFFGENNTINFGNCSELFWIVPHYFWCEPSKGWSFDSNSHLCFFSFPSCYEILQLHSKIVFYLVFLSFR